MIAFVLAIALLQQHAATSPSSAPVVSVDQTTPAAAATESVDKNGTATLASERTRIQFLPRSGSEPVRGAEVCFFAGTPEGPISQFFTSNETFCLPADKVIELPEGAWNFYAKHRDTQRSAWLGMVVVNDASSDSFKRIEVPLFAAQPIAVPEELRDEHVVLFFPGLAGKPPFGIAVPRGAASVLVPSGRTFIACIVESGRIVTFGPPQLSASIAVARPGDGTWDAVVEVLPDWRGLQPADVSALDVPVITGQLKSGKAVTPLATSPEVFSSDLLFFASIPGDSDLFISSNAENWDSASAVVGKQLGENRTASTRLRLIPGGAAVIHIPSAPQHERKPDACADDTETNLINLELFRCPPSAGAPPASRVSGCTRVDGLELKQSELTSPPRFAGLKSGEYLLKATWAMLPPQYESFEVRAPRQTEVDAPLRFGTIFGNVTLDGKPVAAGVRFETGYGWSDPTTGSYSATVVADPEAQPIRVAVCGGDEFIDVPSAPVRVNSRYDIALRTSVFTIKVRSEHDAPVTGAEVTLALVDPKGGTSTSIKAPSTSDAGESVVRGRPDAPAIVCVRHPDYHPLCTEPIASTTEETTVVVKRSDAREICLTSAQPLVAGRFAFVDSAGQVTERGRLEQNGCLLARVAHPATEALVIVSRNAPLVVIPAPAAGPVQLPFGSTIDIDVSLNAGEGPELRPLGLRVSGFVVPSSLLTFHQAMRGQQPTISGGSATRISQVAATGALIVMLGPVLNEPPPETLFTAPQFAPLIRAAVVPVDGKVSF
jgi:hypothetical protein